MAQGGRDPAQPVVNPPNLPPAQTRVRQGRRLLARAAAFVGALFLLAFALRVGASIAFPFAGAEFHALYRSFGGRLQTALLAYAAYATSLAVMASALVWFRYPLGWRALWCAATVIGVLAWLRICRFPVQSTRFTIVAALGLVAMPIVLYAAVRVADRVRVRARPRR